jgi:hypothetical protein
MVTTITLTSIDNNTTKVKRLKEYGFCVFCFSFVWVLFCGVSFFFFNVFIKLRNFFITKNLVIIYKLNIIESFYYKERNFITILVFFVFVTILKK